MRYLVAAISLFVVVGCGNTTTSDRPLKPISVQADRPAEAAHRYMEAVVSLSYTGIMREEQHFYEQHGDEIMETLEVVEVDTVEEDTDHPLAVVFMRYSVGARVFRQAEWLRDIGTGWVPTMAHFDEIDYDHPLRERANEWEKEGAKMYP